MTIIEKAQEFATAAHTGQVRKYTGEPYITHPIQVAEIVSRVSHTPEMIAAALLHDVVEDTPVTLDEIRTEFGDTVADLVYWLTAPSKGFGGTRAQRKEMDRHHMEQAPPEAQTIKLADIIHNTSSIVEKDPEFAVVYLEEKRLMLDCLLLGDQTLLSEAKKIL